MKYLIAGLGNPGEKYKNTRHNIGYKVLDTFANESDTFFASERYAQKCTLKHKGRQLILIKPTTYMNLSGKAIRYWLEKEKIPIQNLLVIVDDLALPFGFIRMKKNGGDGNHNGLTDIIETLGHQNFSRIRFGIGNDFKQGMQIDYVLGNWTEDETLLLPERIKKIIGAIKSYTFIGADRSMSQFNQKFDMQAKLEELKNDKRDE